MQLGKTPFKVTVSGSTIASNAIVLANNFKAELEKDTTELIKSGSLSDLEVHDKKLKDAQKQIKEYRTEITSPLDATKKDLMEVEKVFTPFITETKKAIDLLKQEEFKKGEGNILKEFDRLVSESKLNIDTNIFKDFVNEKKKAKTYQDLNKKFELSKSAKDNIKAQFDMVANPILEQMALKEKQDAEYEQFNYSLSNAGTEPQIEELRALLPTLYPTIQESAEMAINSKLDIIRAKKVAEEKASLIEDDAEDMKAIKTAYIEAMEMQSINDVSGAIFDIIAKSEILVLKDNITIAQTYIKKLKAHKESIAFKPEPIKETKTAGYKIPQSEIQFLMDFRSDKLDEFEAIEDLVKKLKMHLELTGLEKVEENA